MNAAFGAAIQAGEITIWRRAKLRASSLTSIAMCGLAAETRRARLPRPAHRVLERLADRLRDAEHVGALPAWREPFHRRRSSRHALEHRGEAGIGAGLRQDRADQPDQALGGIRRLARRGFIQRDQIEIDMSSRVNLPDNAPLAES